jgi:hypothetical protein
MKRIEEIERLLKNANTSPDAYAEWKDHSVTRRFMLETELQLLLTMEQTQSAAFGASCEQIALFSVKSATSCIELERVINWIPEELSI